MAPFPRSNPKYPDIEAAVLRLPINDEQMPHVWQLVDYLALMGNIIKERRGDLTLPARSRPATKAMVIKQLVELERRASDLAEKIDRKGGAKRAREQLARHIRELHSPTIAALSEAPEVITPYFVAELPAKLGARRYRTYRREMRFWAEIAKLAAMEMLRPEADRSSEAEDAEFFKMFPEATLNRVDFQPPIIGDVGRPQKNSRRMWQMNLRTSISYLLVNNQPSSPPRMRGKRNKAPFMVLT